MKVAIVSTYDSIGGAARAAFRLHKGLLTKGIDSKMLVQKKDSENNNVIAIVSKKERLWSKIAIRLNNLPLKKYPNKDKYIFSPSIYGGFNEKRYNNQFDLFNIHWVGGGFQSIDSIAKITKPIILTLHDSWAFTGGCHIPYPCEKFVTKCGSCIKLDSNDEIDLMNIPTKTIEQFFKEAIGNDMIELLSLDIEGIDAEILLDLPINLNIKFLSFEYIHLREKEKDVNNFLTLNKYNFLGMGVDYNGFDKLYIKE
jgi:hypothetical protein